MTTPPTPAGWYPDPEQAGQLRYWDGGAWTEHRPPAQQPSAPAAAQEPPAQEPVAQEPVAQEPVAQETAAASPADSGGDHTGAHRADDAEPEPDPVAEQLTTEVPLRQWSFEPPPLEPEVAPGEAFTSQPSSEWEPTTQPEPTTEPEPEATTAPEPTQQAPAGEPAPYADATTPTPAEPPAVEPPAGTEPTAPVDNRKLIVGFGGAVAALLLILALAAVYAFVIHKPSSTARSSSTTQTSTTTTVVTPTPGATASESAPPPPLAGAVDGPLTFAVTGVDSGSTITDPENSFLTKTAQGEFIVVHLTVQNTSPDPGQFLGTFQKLKAAGQVYSIDDEATFYVGGGFVDIPPGGQVEVGLAYDVPAGTVPETVELHADPMSQGVELPVG